MNFHDQLRQRLTQARELRSLSQAELAKRMRRAGHEVFSPARMWEVEAGKRRLAAGEIPDVCRILQVPVWWLLGMTQEEAATLDESWANTSGKP